MPAVVPHELTPQQRRIYRRYSALALPRHTSYPVVPAWRPDYGSSAFREDLLRSAAERRPLSLYVHVPFCRALCYYCACTKEIVPDAKRRQCDPAESFLEGIALEAARFGDLIGPGDVWQVHLGGGSPTFLTPAQLTRLHETLRKHFRIAADAELAVEVDPRVTSHEHLRVLRGLGFNRVSLGVQDFDPAVQRAVNRVQPFDMVERLVVWCRDLGFESINFDLIYGLPFQTAATMSDTLDKTLRLAPDRVAFYRLAVIPEIFRWQNVFRPADLPGGEAALRLNLLAIERFTAAGYEFIGLDHFARPGEALARAARDGTLRRTFQGMTTGKPLDVIGLGPSAISILHDAYAQNHKESGQWRQAVEMDFATERGLSLTADDLVRRELMQQLYGAGVIDKRSLQREFGIDFDDYFADECRRLLRLVADGLVEQSRDQLRLTAPTGRLLMRVVAAIFDRYLPPRAFCDGLAADSASRVG
jgi:oxygen-independent coproporphyrinogen-3 oxidase